MASPRSLKPRENERVREVLRAIIAKDFEGVLLRAAKSFDVSHTILSEILSGGRGAGMKVLTALSRHTGRTMDDLLYGDSPPEAGERAGVHLEREPTPVYAESEAPMLENLPDWGELVATAQSLDEARGVPAWAFEFLGISNGLSTVPMVPSAIVGLAKTCMRYTSRTDAEAKIREIRARQGVKV